MPSEKVLEQKKKKVEQLTEQLKNAASGVVVDYKGITVEQDTKLRKEMREAGLTYAVEKNTMLRFAAKNAGLDGLVDALKGPSAIAISGDDQTAPARILGKYAESSKGKFSLKAGFIGNEMYDAEGVAKLSKIPSRDILLSMLVGSLKSPISGLALMLKAVAEKKEQESA